jgi:hypothetical protein
MGGCGGLNVNDITRSDETGHSIVIAIKLHA